MAFVPCPQCYDGSEKPVGHPGRHVRISPQDRRERRRAREVCFIICIIVVVYVICITCIVVVCVICNTCMINHLQHTTSSDRLHQVNLAPDATKAAAV